MRVPVVDYLVTLARASTERGLDELVELERSVCVPMPLSRRLSFFSLTGGVGCSTVTVEVATMLATLRGEQVRLVDAQGGSPLPQPPSQAGLETLALPPTAWPAAMADWHNLLEAQPSPAQMTITDWGAAPGQALRALSASAHALCVVSDASRASIEHAATIVRSLREHRPVVLCAVDNHRIATSATRQLLTQVPAPSFLLPFDARRPPRAEVPRPLGSRTSHEVLRLSATLMDLLVTPRATHPTRPEAREAQG